MSQTHPYKTNFRKSSKSQYKLPSIIFPTDWVTAEITYELYKLGGDNLKFIDITDIIDSELYHLMLHIDYLADPPKAYTDFCDYHDVPNEVADDLRNIVRDSLLPYLLIYLEMTTHPIPYKRILNNNSIMIFPEI